MSTNGIHHVTAIAASARRSLDFYAQVHRRLGGDMSNSSLPLWVQYFQALGPTLVAVVLAYIAAAIQFRKWRTAYDKLRLELFERRFKIYDETREFLITVFLITVTVHSISGRPNFERSETLQ